MIKVFVLCCAMLVGIKSGAEVPFTQLKGLDEIVKDPAFSNVNGFLVLNGGTAERVRFFGFSEMRENALRPGWIHPAFLVKKGDDPHAFSKQFEYPSDAISALIQWLFPSVDGALFVANDRDKDVVGGMGLGLKESLKIDSQRKNLSELRREAGHLMKERARLGTIKGNNIKNDSRLKGIDREIKEIANRISSLKEQKNMNALREETQNITKLRVQKETIVSSLSADHAHNEKQIQKIGQDIDEAEKKLRHLQDLEEKARFMPKILKCIYEGKSSTHPSQEGFSRCLGISPVHHASATNSSSASSQGISQKERFIEILYNALVQDGTFREEHDALYPKHIALHALLGYLWRVCDTKAQVIAVMREAGLIKEATVHEHRFSRPTLETEKYTKDDYKRIKQSSNPTFEELAFAGYGYEVYEKPNPEMMIYSQADLNPTPEELQRYPYLASHKPYPDCGETALRNFFNLVAFKGSGNFDPDLLPQIQTSHMEKIKSFYQGFGNISIQKHSSANTAWSGIVSNLNGTQNSLESSNLMDVRYDGYTNIKSSLGMINFLNVMAKLTGDSVLNETWETGEGQKRHIARKLNRLCEMFSRGEEFKIEWEVDGQNEIAPVHGNFKLKVTRRSLSYDYTLEVKGGHFVLIENKMEDDDWRKKKKVNNNSTLLEPFYNPNPSPFLNPLIREKQHENFKFWESLGGSIQIPLSLRFLYKNYGSIVQDENAQINIMRGLNTLNRNSLIVKDWIKSLLVDRVGQTNQQRARMFEYEFSQNIDPEVIDQMNLILEDSVKFGLVKISDIIMNNNRSDLKGGLKHAITYGHKKIVEMIINRDKDNLMESILHRGQQLTPLLLASEKGYPDIVEFLLDHGANIQAKSQNGRTCLMRAAFFDNEEVVKILLKRDVKIEEKSLVENNTALILAAWQGNSRITKILLDHGANIEATNSHGRTALMQAVSSRHARAVRVLLRKGANIETKDLEGNTALTISKSVRESHLPLNYEIIKILEDEPKRRAAVQIQKMVRRKQAAKEGLN